MSLMSLYTGVSGLDSYNRAMAVVSNNIANVNTLGFKASRTVFEDLLGQSLVGSTGRFQVGRGVQIAAIHRLFDQSTFQSTGSSTDMAIDGDGFFIVSRDAQVQYTRAGQFFVNQDGLLKNHQNYILQGWSLDNNGNINSTLQDIDVSKITSEPKDTNNTTVHVNLDSDEAILGPGVFDVLDPLNTSNYSTTLTIYDSLGGSHMLTVYFTRADLDTWEWNAVIQGGEVVGQPNDYVAAAGTLDFTDGRLQAEAITNPFDELFVGTAANQAISFDFGTSIGEGGTGLDGTTQFSGVSTTKFLQQDGYGVGNLVSIQIDENGVVRGLFSNGHSRDVYRVALARFNSAWGLTSIGRNLFSETGASGPPIVGIPGTSSLGTIHSNALELSNVDLAAEFVEMIKTQQAFQANSRVITTTDQMLQEVVNLRR